MPERLYNECQRKEHFAQAAHYLLVRVNTYIITPSDRPDLVSIKKISKTHRKPLFRLIELLDINDDIISFYEGLKITASPEEKTATKVSLLRDMVEDLKTLRLIIERNNEIGNYIIKYFGEDPEEDNEAVYELKISRHL